jgi:acetyl esterase/lipase
MSFDDLPALPRLIHPDGNRYVERIMTLGRLAQQQTRCVLDQSYGSDYWQRLDVYLPTAILQSSLPVFSFLPGGAWINGCKEWLAFMAPVLTSVPAVFVALSYRHAPAAKFPAQLEDTVEGLAWVHRNIVRWGGDAKRVYLGGHSAGGHLAALATLRRDALAARELPLDFIRACLPISAPFDLMSDDSVRRQKVAAFLEHPEDVTAASPIAHVEGNRTPFIITYGTEDLPELVPQAMQMIAALKSAGTSVESLVLEGRNHFNTHEDCALADSPWMREVSTLLREGPPG